MSVQKPHILLITTDEQHRDTIFAPRKPYSRNHSSDDGLHVHTG